MVSEIDLGFYQINSNSKPIAKGNDSFVLYGFRGKTEFAIHIYDPVISHSTLLNYQALTQRAFQKFNRSNFDNFEILIARIENVGIAKSLNKDLNGKFCSFVKFDPTPSLFDSINSPVDLERWNERLDRLTEIMNRQLSTLEINLLLTNVKRDMRRLNITDLCEFVGLMGP